MINISLYNFTNNLNNLIEVAQSELNNIVEQSNNEIIDKNKQQMFNDSIDATGKEFPTYSIATSRLNENKSFTYNGKSKQKTPNEKYTLFDTGDFFSSIRVLNNEKSFEIVGQTQKEDNNLLKYGKILGLTEKNRKYFNDKWTKQLTEILEIFLHY